MAKKNRSAAAKTPSRRGKASSPAAADDANDNDHAKSNQSKPLRITKAPKPPKPPDLNNRVNVHIISVPSDGSAPTVSSTVATVAPVAPASPAVPVVPGAKTPATNLPPPPAAHAAAVSAGSAGAATPAKLAAVGNAASQPKPAPRSETPAGGLAIPRDPLAPTPVHKSAINLTPMEQMLWSARLQKAKEVVAKQMKVQVTGGKLVRRYTAIDHDDGLFEIETDKGFYVAVLSKTGEFSIYWRHDRKAY